MSSSMAMAACERRGLLNGHTQGRLKAALFGVIFYMKKFEIFTSALRGDKIPKKSEK